MPLFFRLSFLLVLTLTLNLTQAEEGDVLSAAEQAAIAAAEAAAAVDVRQRRIDMCHQVLLSGMAEQKAELLAMLDGRTCAEAVEDMLSGQSESTE